MAKSPSQPPVVVIFGDEEYQKALVLRRTLDALLPPDVDRAMALCVYEGTRGPEDGGPTFAGVADDLSTLPFLADRRVVVVREADRFISANREKLEAYLESPSPVGTLVLECRSFPKTTRLYKSAAKGQIHECKKLTGRALTDFVLSEAQSRKKQMDYDTAARLAQLIGAEQGALASEVEKLSLYALDRPRITAQDVEDLVGLSREEKIFAVMDAAAAGRAPDALQLWNQVLATDPAAAYKAVGGMAYTLRRWLAAQRMRAEGMSVESIAPKVMMYGRAKELGDLLRRLPLSHLKRLLSALADLDAQVKTGLRSMETGIEALLVQLAAPAA